MHQFHAVKPARRTRRWISLLAASAAACSIVAGSVAPAHAAVAPIPADTPMKLKFKHSGMVGEHRGRVDTERRAPDPVA